MERGIMAQRAVFFEEEQQRIYQFGQQYSNLLAQTDFITKQLGAKQKALEQAQHEIDNLKAGFYGSDWKLCQDSAKNQIRMFDGNRQEILTEATLQKVIAYTLQSSKGSQFAFSVEFRLSSGVDREIFLSQRDLESATAMVQKLERAGIYLQTKRSDRLKTRLLSRMIMEHISEVVLIPEYAGWDNHTFCFCDSSGSYRLRQIGFSAPYLDRYFTNLRFGAEEMEAYINSLFSQLGKECATLLLTVTAGSLLYTPLKEKGYQPNVLFALEGETDTVSGIRKWMQPWEEELCVSLTNKKNVIRSLDGSKDELFFLLDEGTKYSLNLGPFLNTLGSTGELAVDGKIKQLKSVLLLITGRSKIWKKNNLLLLNLPFTQKKESKQIKKELASDFWHSFCDFLNNTYGILIDKLEKLLIPTYSGERYSNVYQWLAASYNIFAPFLKLIVGENGVLSEWLFSRYTGTWLLSVEQQDDMDVGDYFIFCLQREKENNQITFVKIDTLADYFTTNLMLATDSEWVYIGREVFTSLVQKFLPGCSEKEVYVSLAESGSAKLGEGSHIFPKAPLKASQNGMRVRMARIRRSLLLTDAELLLEV